MLIDINLCKSVECGCITVLVVLKVCSECSHCFVTIGLLNAFNSCKCILNCDYRIKVSICLCKLCCKSCKNCAECFSLLIVESSVSIYVIGKIFNEAEVICCCACGKKNVLNKVVSCEVGVVCRSVVLFNNKSLYAINLENVIDDYFNSSILCLCNKIIISFSLICYVDLLILVIRKCGLCLCVAFVSVVYILIKLCIDGVDKCNCCCTCIILVCVKTKNTKRKKVRELNLGSEYLVDISLTCVSKDSVCNCLVVRILYLCKSVDLISDCLRLCKFSLCCKSVLCSCDFFDRLIILCSLCIFSHEAFNKSLNLCILCEYRERFICCGDIVAKNVLDYFVCINCRSLNVRYRIYVVGNLGSFGNNDCFSFRLNVVCYLFLFILCCVRYINGCAIALNNVRDGDVEVVLFISFIINTFVGLVAAKNNCIALFSSISEDKIKDIVTSINYFVSIVNICCLVAITVVFKCVRNYDCVCVYDLLIAERCFYLVRGFTIEGIICCDLCNDCLLDILVLIGRGGCCESINCILHVVVEGVLNAINLNGAVVVILHHVVCTDCAIGLFVVGILVESCEDSIVDFFYNDLVTLLARTKVFLFDLNAVKSLHKLVEIECHIVLHAVFCKCVIYAACEHGKNCNEEKNCCDNSLFHCVLSFFYKIFQYATRLGSIYLIYKPAMRINN